MQVAALAAFRAYRGVWRHFGVQDAAALAQGVAAASIASTLVVVFVWRNEGFSRAVFVIDAALLTVLLFGARGLVRFVSDAFGGFARDGTRVLVVGTGEHGVLCLRALRARDGDRVTPVGFLADDPSLGHRRIQGVPVVGTPRDLRRAVAELRVDEVVLARLPPDEELAVLRDAARQSGARLTLSPHAGAFAPL